MDSAVAMCIDAWADLNTCRPSGMALGPIPFTAILTWAEFPGQLDHDLTMLLLAVIRILDRDLLEREASKRTLKGGS